MGYSPYSQHLVGHPGLHTELKDSQSHGDSVLPPPPTPMSILSEITHVPPATFHEPLTSSSEAPDRKLSLMFLLHSQERQYHWTARPFHSLSAICKFSIVALYTKDSF